MMRRIPIFCPDACTVTALTVNIDAINIIDQDPIVDFYSVDTTVDPADLDGSTALGNVFGLTNVVIAFGALSTGTPNFALINSTEAHPIRDRRLSTWSPSPPPCP